MTMVFTAPSPWPAARAGAHLLFLCALLLAGGCATSLSQIGPEQIPQLEQEVQANPDDAEARTRLGVAYYNAERFQDARTTLEAALEAGATSGAPYLYLGLTHEELEDWSAAREAYSAYLSSDRAGPLRSEIEARMAYIAQQEMRAEAQAALDREAQLSTQDPEPRSVAVFPFRIVSDDPQLEPLSVALADMMITDLALAGGLTVLERTMVQALLNEMALTEAGYTEPATGARAGRMLRSEHVVQGALTTLGQDRLRLATDVRHTVRRETTGELEDENTLQQLFDLEKETVFQVLDVLGVDLTPAEREAINENRAENILAFLAYGRGLQALDRGDYQEAMSQFEQALELDPGFDMAQGQLEQASRIQQATGVQPAQLAERVAAEEAAGATGIEGADQPATGGGPTSEVLQETASHTNPNRGRNLTDQGSPESGTDRQAEERNPTQEAQSADQVSAPPVGTINIVIQRPGGGGE